MHHHGSVDGTMLKKRQRWLNGLSFPRSFTLQGNHLLQSWVFISSSFSCQAFKLTGSHLFHLNRVSAPIFLLRFLNLSCFCSSVSAGVTRSLLLSAVWVSCEAGSPRPSVFSLSTQLLALAIHRHTVGTHASAAYIFRCRCQHNCCPCTVSAQTPTVLPGYKRHLSSPWYIMKNCNWTH